MKMCAEFNSSSGLVAKMATTVSNDPVVLGQQIIKAPGVGKHFLMWVSTPAGTLVSCQFEDPDYPAPIINADPAVNTAAINAMLADPPPYSLLTFA